MNNKLIIGGIAFFLIVGLYFINLKNQKSYTSSSTKLLHIEKDNIKKILIQSGTDALELMRQDSTWKITGVDTLVIKEQSITSLFDNLFSLETQMLMTERKEKWSTYSVDDSLGTHIALVDWNDTTIGYYVFGRSTSDYSRCYVRTNNSPNVYLTSNNVMYNLQTRPEYWGENPTTSNALPQEISE